MSWYPTRLLHPSTHWGNTSCSTKAQMNTNPEGLSIKLHILTAASLVQCNVFWFMCLKHFETLSLQERREANESSLNIYQNIVYRLHCKRQKSPKPAVDIREVAQPEYRSGQTVLSLSIRNKALLIVILEGVKPATNRKSSRGSSELL